VPADQVMWALDRNEDPRVAAEKASQVGLLTWSMRHEQPGQLDDARGGRPSVGSTFQPRLLCAWSRV